MKKNSIIFMSSGGRRVNTKNGLRLVKVFGETADFLKTLPKLEDFGRKPDIESQPQATP